MAGLPGRGLSVPARGAVLIAVLLAVAAQVEEQRLVALAAAALPHPQLGLIVQEQVWRVVATTVCHHDRADATGIDVLDLEEALYHIYVLRLHILEGGGGGRVRTLKGHPDVPVQGREEFERRQAAGRKETLSRDAYRPGRPC